MTSLQAKQLVLAQRRMEQAKNEFKAARLRETNTAVSPPNRLMQQPVKCIASAPIAVLAITNDVKMGLVS